KGPVTRARKKLAIITSAYNESECIDELARRLGGVFDQLSDYECEAIVVENGSEDDTFERLEDICRRDPRFKVIQLARNFRMDGGLTAGLEFVDADAVVLMTADLQDPPEMIPRFVAQWEQGYENVYGIVTVRRGTGAVRRMNSRLFYWVIGKLTGHLIPANASDFRLLDRRVYEVVREMDERNRFVRGLVAWVGFRSIGVEHEREERFAGTSKAHSRGVAQLAIKAIFAHSQVPLVMIPLVGAGLFVASLIALIALAIDWVTRGVPFPGFGTIVALMVMLFGILFCLLGIVSIYIGQIYDEVKGRPNFIVRQTLGIGGSFDRSNSVVVALNGDTDLTRGPENGNGGVEHGIESPTPGTNGAGAGRHAAPTDGDSASTLSGS
ncbi:MAG: glycosyltransferase family 2 protein, partial [Acidimicrobiales bacterium]